MANIWRYQKLEDEKLHYITECHPEDGILGEYFFEYHEYGKLIDFCLEKGISFEEIQLPLTSKVVNNDEYFANLLKLAKVDFACRIRLYDSDKEGNLYKNQYAFTLEMMENLSEEQLGTIMKQLLTQLKQYINEEENKRLNRG